MTRTGKTFVLLLTLTVSTAVVRAAEGQHPRDEALRVGGAACDPCEPVCNPCDNVFGTRCGKKSLFDQFKLYGWIQAGIQVNDHGCKNSYTDEINGPASRELDAFSGNSYLLMTQQPSDFHVNQVWLGLTKKVDAKHGFDWGFQADVCFGTDAKFGQCFGDQSFDYDWGSGDYYTSIVQLYAEVGYKKWTVRAGKFAGNMTHEVLPAMASFFYSHAYACYNTPLTVSGAIVDYAVTKNLSISGGWTAGYHGSFENRFDDAGFRGNATWRPTKKTSLAYNIYYGDNNGLNRRDDALTRYSRAYDRANEFVQTLIFTYQLNTRWSYMIEGLYVDNDMKADSIGLGHYHTRSRGINQHLIYTINKKWAVGARFEWLRAEGTIFDAAPYTGAQGGDLYELTFGANWNPVPHFTLRPELRYDWADYDNGFKPFNHKRDKEQLSGGCAAIVYF